MIVARVCSKLWTHGCRCSSITLCSTIEMDMQTAIIESGKQLGYDKLRPKQIQAMSSFIEGNDVFVSLPTGYGKSIIYAAFPMHLR